MINMQYQFLVLIFCMSCLFGCNNQYEFQETDGIYCANVEYFYAETITTNLYISKVEIQKQRLKSIYLSNNVKLSADSLIHIGMDRGLPGFRTLSGVDLFVKLKSEKNCISPIDAPHPNTFLEQIKSSLCLICSKQKRLESNNICNSCMYQYENICPRCGITEEGVNSNLCSSCQLGE